MKLRDICRRAGIKCPKALFELEITGITSNSKRVDVGNLFFCLSGTKNDGHHFVEEALKLGAASVVIEKEEFLCEKAVLVEDTRVALAKMMNIFCGEPTKRLKFIGITGTNGKTSVSVMIKNVFDTLQTPCEVIGTLNCSSFSEKSNDPQANVTTPDPEELYPMLRRMSDAGIRVVVMEASSHALKLKKLAPIDFEIGIFTNLTEDHLDFHKDMEDYFKSKLCLFDKCKLGIINVDDEYGMRIKNLAPCKIKTCSTEQDADFSVMDIKDLCEKGTRYTLKHENDGFEVECKVPGIFSIMNSMQACACALELKIDKKIIERSFENFAGVKGRLEKVELSGGQPFAVFIDYAHTPDALFKLLETVNTFKNDENRVVLLFGCGGDRERQKRKIMGKIAVSGADRVIVTSDNPRSEEPRQIINDILEGMAGYENYTVIPDRKAAIEYAMANARAGDIILLAGKGHENYEINARGRFGFDEREIVRAAFDKLYKEE